MRKFSGADLAFQVSANFVGAAIGLVILKLALHFADQTQYTLFSSIFYAVNLVVLIVFSANNVLSAKLHGAAAGEQERWEGLFPTQFRCAVAVAAPVIALAAATSSAMRASELIAIGAAIFAGQIVGEMTAFSQANAVSKGRTSMAASISLAANGARLGIASLAIIPAGVIAIAFGNLAGSMARFWLNRRFFGRVGFSARSLLRSPTLIEARQLAGALREGLPGLFVRQNTMFYLPAWLWIGVRTPSFVESGCYLLVPILGIIGVVSQSVTTYVEGKLLSGEAVSQHKLLARTAATGIAGLVVSMLFLDSVAAAFLGSAPFPGAALGVGAGALFFFELVSWTWLVSYRAARLQVFAQRLLAYQAVVALMSFAIPGDRFSLVLALFAAGRLAVAGSFRIVK